VGLNGALERIASGDLLVLDGLRGRVIVDPTVEQLQEAERRAARYATMARELGASRDQPALTKDGVRVTLQANIELPDEAAVALEHGAEGIGLYRTEFVYVNRTEQPTEEEQFEIFKRVVEQMGPRPVTLRTFDIGGDKFVTTFRLPSELNPMLGLRAVRLALAEPKVFSAHLRAMLRASAFGDVRILIPMVSAVAELTQVRELLQLARRQVVERGQACADDIPLGVMIEVPAAAVMASTFAAQADFMSIGTNDLVQYALAVDRTNRALAHLASPYHPSILRMVHGVIRAGRENNCPVSLCGEMASEIYGALLLLGLGLRDLSMESVAIPEIKEAISRARLAELEQLAERALALGSAEEVVEMLDEALEGRVHDLLTGQPDSMPGSLRSPSSSGHGVH
jgi:phosphotransferase system enzyme I (PtsI)